MHEKTPDEITRELMQLGHDQRELQAKWDASRATGFGDQAIAQKLMKIDERREELRLGLPPAST
jgi:hypothetical protein